MQDFRLKVFLEVALERSFSKAALRLFISQPAVSRNIKELESQLGSRLFERKGHIVELTEAGRILMRHARVICGIYDEIGYDLGQLRERTEGEVLLGASFTLLKYIMPQCCVDYYKSFPNVYIKMLSGNSESIERKLIDEEISIGFVEGEHENSQLS
ncbi:MAG: LysR family transcriptional regulator, partial [Lentisphaeria bacterium]